MDIERKRPSQFYSLIGKPKLTIRSAEKPQGDVRILLNDMDVTGAIKRLTLDMAVGDVNSATIDFLPGTLDVEVVASLNGFFEAERR